MPSILPEYQYDIFISYRQKDNEYDGWVTEFVDNLKHELSATFKEDISIYFDENPDDGLLESHDVDQSLNEKIKVLIFIPIVSQTYCDPNCFAWQKEFLAFRDFAKDDQFGLDIKLTSGNVAKRILPVRIHEIDETDKQLFEKEVSSVMRPIEFIYKSAGVNRPLRESEEHPDDNVNRTIYRDQINKVANSIKEIITAIKGGEISQIENKENRPESTTKASSVDSRSKNKRLVLLAFIGVVVILALVYLFYYNHSDNEEAKIENDQSIAVLPFEDMSPKGDQEYFSDGISEEILNVLTRIPNLKVIGRTSSFSFKGKDVTIKEIGDALNVNTVLEGSVRKMGNRVKITAQLIDVEGGFHIWSETYERDLNDIFKIQEEVAQMIATKLMSELSLEDLKEVKVDEITNYQAYEYYLKGKYLHDIKFLGGLEKREDFDASEEMFLKAIELDSSFALAHSELANLYNTGTAVFRSDSTFRTVLLALQLKEIKIAYVLDPNSSAINQIMGWVMFVNSSLDSTYQSFNRALELNPNVADNFRALAYLYYILGLYDEALYLYDQSIKLDPLSSITNSWIMSVYRSLGNLKELQNLALDNLKIEPRDINALYRLTYSYIMKNELVKADSLLGLMYSLNPNSRFISRTENYLNAAKGNENLITNYSPTVYLLLGKTELAMKSLMDINRPGRSYYLRYKNNSFYDPLRNDPRFIQLIEEEKKQYDINKKRYALDLPKPNL